MSEQNRCHWCGGKGRNSYPHRGQEGGIMYTPCFWCKGSGVEK